jgi:molecular chaperone GrpE
MRINMSRKKSKDQDAQKQAEAPLNTPMAHEDKKAFVQEGHTGEGNQKSNGTTPCTCGDECETKIRELEKKLSASENGWQRALADYQNLKRRVAQQQEEILFRANERIIEKLLDVLMNLQNVTGHVEDQGLKMVLGQFENILKDEGLEEIKVEDSPFDPLTMEATDVVPGEKGKVIEVAQKGYKLNEKLIRPARVKVGSGQENNSPAPEESSKETSDQAE